MPNFLFTIHPTCEIYLLYRYSNRKFEQIDGFFSLLFGCSPLFLKLFLAQRLKKVFEARAFLVIASGQKHFRILMYPSNGKYGVIYGLVVQRIYFHALYYMYLLHFYFMQKKNFTGI